MPRICGSDARKARFELGGHQNCRRANEPGRLDTTERVMSTKRIRLERPLAEIPITEKMIDLYGQMAALECSCPRDRKPGKPCAACEEWYRLLTPFDREVPLDKKRPWQILLCSPSLVLTADGTWRPREPLPYQARLEARLQEALAARYAKAKAERALARAKAKAARKEKPPEGNGG